MHRGTIVDAMFITFFLIFVMLAIIIVYAALGAINSSMIGFGLDTSILQSSMGAIGNFNDLMLFIYVGCGVACMISAFAVRTHPIFFIIFLIVEIFFIALTPMIQDTYNTVVAVPSMNASAGQFPNFQTLINQLPMISAILSTLIALVMFALPG